MTLMSKSVRALAAHETLSSTMMTMKALTAGVCLASLIAIFALFLAARDLGSNLSPQGCRMSWMSPSYILQKDFNTSWTPLADRYSLWLYREVAYDSAKVRFRHMTF